MRRQTPDVERIWTVLDLVNWGTEYFERKGVDSPRLTIELMLCDVLDVRRLQLYTDHERPLTKEELSVLRAYVRRRAEREPLQYILGKADFYGLSFTVDPNVLIPRPETEIIVDRAIRLLREVGGLSPRCLDVGTGSGCIPVSIAVHDPTSVWVGIDVHDGALEVARRNAEAHAVGSRVTFTTMDFLADIPSGTFDLITMNPPYIPLVEIHELEPEVRDHEPLTALTDDLDGFTFYRRFAAAAPKILSPTGTAFLEIGYGQSTEILALMTAGGLLCTIIEDLAGIPRVAKISWGSVTKS
ncbi:MAG: peptide chain release factor N(5)-glutamine methyltransferase [Ignavibacteria bacterium]|nr:peptide chain release factor N(5)-glutamine methyltransferase [Ignavibacteria bacterium]